MVQTKNMKDMNDKNKRETVADGCFIKTFFYCN